MGGLILLILMLVLFGPVVIAAVRSRMNRRSSAPNATPRSAAEAAFYREAPHGRVFDCGRCAKPLSPDQGSCQHCGATFDYFPPIRTDRLF